MNVTCFSRTGEAVSCPFQNECFLIPSVSASDTFLCLGRGNLKLSSDVADHFLPSGFSDQYSTQIVSGFPLGFALVKEGIFKQQTNSKEKEKSVSRVLSNRSFRVQRV